MKQPHSTRTLQRTASVRMGLLLAVIAIALFGGSMLMQSVAVH